MAKINFLKTEADFASFRQSRLYQGAALKIRVRIVPHQNAPRFGFIIPKKILPKVTDRNVIKRRLKGILSKHLKQVGPAEILFFPQRPALKQSYAQLEAETLKLFAHARVWKS